ncbi:MAG: transketolase [Clostridiales bacterium]|nr:transketolase [Clostridiales bacterium]
MAEKLAEKARQYRLDVLDMLYTCQSGHPGGSLSCVEILQALYENVLKYDPKNPKWADRDRMVLSKGHACPTLYAILADKGFFPREELKTLRAFGSHLQGHPDMNKCPGIDASTGSLGQGASWAVGYALAGKRPEHHFNVYCVTGDGESQEGMIWESAMAAAHFHLDNLTVLLDHNGLQIDGTNDQVMSLGDICAKYEAFGWEVMTVDGHDVDAITEAVKKPRCGKPRFICCNTVKGKGVSFMENQVGWHGKPMSQADYEAARRELEV